MDAKPTALDGLKLALKAIKSLIRVDSKMSPTSTNPVENRVVKKYVDDRIRANRIRVDHSISYDSNNPVANRVVKEYVDSSILPDTARVVNTTYQAPSNKTLSDFAYGNGKYVAMDAGKCSQIYYSLDGLSWTTVTLPLEAYWGNLKFINGVFITTCGSVAGDPTYLCFSTDAIDWTTASLELPTGSKYIRDYVYFKGKIFLLPSDTGKQVLTSPDPATFTKVDIFSDSHALTGIACYEDVLMVLGDKPNAAVAYTNDGDTWHEVSLPYADFQGRSAVYLNGLFILASIRNDGKILSSSDAITWTEHTIPYSGSWGRVMYGNGIYAIKNTASGKSNQLVFTKDLLNWQTVEVALSGTSFNFEFVRDKFIFRSYGKREIAYSTDMLNWTIAPIPIPASDHDMNVLNGTIWMSSPYGGRLLLSDDGVNWRDAEQQLVTYSGDAVKFTNKLPNVTLEDNGKVLCVVDGMWTLVDPKNLST